MDKIIKKRMFFHTFFIQSVLNFDKMQNVGFAFSILPLIKKIFKTEIEKKEALNRHFEHFNTQPYMANLILGLISGKEEELLIAEDKEMVKKDIYRLKETTGRAFASIGDTFFWGTWRPFLSLISVIIVALGIILNIPWLIVTGICAFLIAYNIVSIAVRWYGLSWGYKEKEKIISKLFKFKPIIYKIENIIKNIGLIILAGFSVFVLSYVLNYLDIEDNLMIYLLSGLIVIGIGFTIRHVSSLRIAMLIIIISVIQICMF